MPSLPALVFVLAAATSAPASAGAPGSGIHLAGRADAGPSARFRLLGDEGSLPPTREELTQEYRELEANEVGLGLPIGMTAGGVAAAIVGYVMLIYGAAGIVVGSSSPSRDASTFLSVGLVLAVVGVAALAAGIAFGVVGGIRVGKAIRARVLRTRRMNQIQEQLKQPEQDGSPLPPPTVRAPLPGSLVTLATF